MVAALARVWSPSYWLFLLALLPLLAGCDGCRLTKPTAEEVKKLEQQQPPFTSTAAQAYPAGRADAGNSGFPDGCVKPGHWTSVELTLKSNRDDRRGVVQTRAEVAPSDATFVDENLFEMALSESSKSILVRRPAVLPKGQRRRLDTRLLVPDRGSRVIDAVRFEGEFLAGDSTGRFDLRPARFAAMQPQTYFFVILTDRPERFARLQRADWLSVHQDDESIAKSRDNYRIIIPPTQGILPIAETALDWTSTAVLLWDDISTSALTPAQRTAILDWLHFGGLLIVNGPAAVDSLSDRMFSDLLPIEPGGVDQLSAANAQQLIHSLNVATDLSVETVSAGLGQGASQVATTGQKRVDAVEIGQGGLILQRRVGRGRIVQSRVDLLSDWLMQWQSYNSFFNSAVLGRPPRVYRLIAADDLAKQLLPVPASPDEPLESMVDDPTILPPLRQTFVGVDVEIVDPAINTGLRFFARDAKLPAPSVTTEAGGEMPANNPVLGTAAGPLDRWLSTDVWTHPTSGLGGWKNDSPMLAWSRDTLRHQMGVTIPDSTLVFRSLLIYLIVLIPVNYFVFRMLGRLEWAWLAVVPLAILGALWVAHAAQLDVGFARSRNEIAMLELPKDYSRGHLTRVIGLYNSLASQYRVEFDSPDAAIQIIRTPSSADNRDANLFGTIAPELLFGFEAGPVLENISVGSNSYGIVHTEQIIDIEGSISIQRAAQGNPIAGNDIEQSLVFNASSLELLDTFIIQRDLLGQTRIAPLGTLASSARKPIRLQSADRVNVPADLPMDMTDAMQRLLTPETIAPGSARLIARVEQPLGGITLSPDCQQVRAQTLILVHLAYPPQPPAIPDENLITDFSGQPINSSEVEKPANR